VFALLQTGGLTKDAVARFQQGVLPGPDLIRMQAKGARNFVDRFLIFDRFKGDLEFEFGAMASTDFWYSISSTG